MVRGQKRFDIDRATETQTALDSAELIQIGAEAVEHSCYYGST
jgi:hypothetical protein